MLIMNHDSDSYNMDPTNSCENTLIEHITNHLKCFLCLKKFPDPVLILMPKYNKPKAKDIYPYFNIVVRSYPIFLFHASTA